MENQPIHPSTDKKTAKKETKRFLTEGYEYTSVNENEELLVDGPERPLKVILS